MLEGCSARVTARAHPAVGVGNLESGCLIRITCAATGSLTASNAQFQSRAPVAVGGSLLEPGSGSLADNMTPRLNIAPTVSLLRSLLFPVARRVRIAVDE